MNATVSQDRQGGGAKKENVGIEESFGHPLQRGGRTRRAASFLVSDMDNFIDQRRIFRAAE